MVVSFKINPKIISRKICLVIHHIKVEMTMDKVLEEMFKEFEFNEKSEEMIWNTTHFNNKY